MVNVSAWQSHQANKWNLGDQLLTEHTRIGAQIFVTLAGATLAINTSVSENIGCVLERLKTQSAIPTSFLVCQPWFEGQPLEPERNLSGYATITKRGDNDQTQQAA